MKSPTIYTPKFIADADAAFRELRDGLDWERRPDAPRSEYYCNDIKAPYAYGTRRGRRIYEPREWHPRILSVREALEALAGCKFEVCFLNMYLNASDALGWHADNSPEMDDNRPIGVVSLGAERDILFRPNGGGAETVERLRLENGSLCLMGAGMQDTWQHRIPKASFVCGPRISLTFRGYYSVFPKVAEPGELQGDSTDASDLFG